MSKRIFPILALALSLAACSAPQRAVEVTLSEQELYDKIRGGWAGQTIGVVFGAPTEFKFTGTTIQDYQPIPWSEHYVKYWWDKKPGLFDDIYNDLTFVETFEQEGLDCTTETLARRFAFAEYHLAHANQAGRYNIRNGIMPPASGNWVNNPHADDLDFQIEADFIGLMAPGLMPEALDIASRVGHIMNSGDGFYGGIYIGALYSLAFVCDDIPTIVREALRTIPPQSKYRRCIEDVIRFHEEFPDDWRRCWLEIERRYAYEKGCPEGVFNGFNIDATINSAYVVMGLLYGNGDFERTMDVATRCGQDSDCNPASAAGILGVMKGYDAIPDKWKPAMEKVVDIDFPYTSISLNKIYDINLDLLTQMIGREGGSVEDGVYRIVLQRPEELPYEESFATVEPTERRVLKLDITDEATLRFTGNSVVVMGQVRRLGLGGDDGYVARIEASIDGKLVENIEMPYDYIKRKYDIFYTYELPVDGPHTLNLKWTNPDPSYVIEAKEMVVYSAKK